MRLRPGSALALALLLGSLFGPCGLSIATAGPRLNAVTIGFGAGSIAGGGDRAMASPVFTIGFARTVTERVAIEGALSDVTLGDHLGFGELQLGVLVFAQPMRRVEAILPFVRVGVTSGDFLSAAAASGSTHGWLEVDRSLLVGERLTAQVAVLPEMSRQVDTNAERHDRPDPDRSDVGLRIRGAPTAGTAHA